MAIRTYKITLDSKNTIAPEPVYLRQGDKTGAVVIDATLIDNGSPVSLSGLAPMFKANTADGQAVIADSTGFNIINASGGEFTYQVPNALAAVPGKIVTAYFSFSDASGLESTFDVAFIIKKAVDITQAQADDYITIIDGTLDSLRDQMNSLKIDFNKIINNYNVGDFYNKQETDSKDSTTLSNSKTYTDNSIKGVSSVPETFSNLAAIKAKYPNGANGVMVAADNGHKYIWANNVWTDAGIYQATGFADNSVDGKTLKEASITTDKISAEVMNNNQWNDTQNDLTLNTVQYSEAVGSIAWGKSYIQPKPASGNGLLKISAVINNDGEFTFFTAKKNSDGTMTVLDIDHATLSAGLSTFVSNLRADGPVYYGMVIKDGSPKLRNNPVVNYTPLNAPKDLTVGTSFAPGKGGSNETAGFYAKAINNVTLEDAAKTAKDANNYVFNYVNQEFGQGTARVTLSSTAKATSQTLQELDNDVWTFWGQELEPKNIVFNGLSVVVQLSTLDQSKNYKWCGQVRDVKTRKLTCAYVSIDPSKDYSEPTKIYFDFHREIEMTNGVIVGVSIVDENNIVQKVNSTGVMLTDGYDANIHSTDASGERSGLRFATTQSVHPEEIFYSYLSQSAAPSKTYTGIDYELLSGDMSSSYSINDPKSTNKIPSFSALKFRPASGNFARQPDVYYLGRWFDTNDGVMTINQGAEIDAKFAGTSIAADINALATLPCLAVSIDGGEFNRIQMTANGVTNLVGNLDEGNHYIRLIMDGVQEHDDLWVGHKGIIFKQFIVDGDSTIKTIPIRPANKVTWFIGDSITAGINVLGNGANPTVNSATSAYDFVCSNKLNLTNIRIAFGATGITQKGSGGVPAAKDYLDSVVGGVAESVQDYPDLIVINYGTNDSGATSAVFIETYRDYLKKLNIKMPGIPVFVMVPFKGTHSADFKQIIDGFNNVTLIKSDTWNISSPNTGHPDAKNSTIAGQRLAEELLNNMESGYFK